MGRVRSIRRWVVVIVMHMHVVLRMGVVLRMYVVVYMHVGLLLRRLLVRIVVIAI